MAIESFTHKGLRELWEHSASRLVDRNLHARIRRLLDRLDQAQKPEDMHFAGTKYHPLHGFKPTRYAVSVNGPWRLTFEFADGNAYKVDLEQYH